MSTDSRTPSASGGSRMSRPVSSSNANRVCGARTITTSYCGRKPRRGAFTTNWDDVTCADCLAARRADAEGGSW